MLLFMLVALQTAELPERSFSARKHRAEFKLLTVLQTYQRSNDSQKILTREDVTLVMSKLKQTCHLFPMMAGLKVPALSPAIEGPSVNDVTLGV